VRFAAIVLHRGTPPRGSTIAAEEMRLHGKEVIAYSLDVLRECCERVEVTEPVPSEELEDEIFALLKSMANSPGGAPDFILLHDGARPLITRGVVQRVMTLLTHGRRIVTVSASIADSVFMNNTISNVGCLLQTPEGFPFSLLLSAHEWRTQQRKSFASGASLVSSWLGVGPTLVSQDFSNSRIETYKDIAAVEGILKFGQPCINDSPQDLNGLHMLVLGGSGGIGRACVEVIEELGATYRAPTRQELDLRLEQEFGDIGDYHAILHAAGEYEGPPNDIMKVNFFSCFNLLRQAEVRGWKGNIVFISSSSSTWGRPGIPVYSASKAALNALIEAEAERLAGKGINVNAIAPAKVDTRLQRLINPLIDASAMLSPQYVAQVVARYLVTDQVGRIVYLRKGFDTD
jgi:2-C-methyl-D-erythritol 4-phosphate cytidylyltransferase